MIRITGITSLKDVIISSGIVPPTNNGPVLTTDRYNFVTYESMNTTPSLTELLLHDTLIPLSAPTESLTMVPSLTRLALPPEIKANESLTMVPSLTRLALPLEIKANESLTMVPSLTRLDFSITYDRYSEALSTIPSLTELTLT